jgi:ferric-dicitrate binding protein FerR (iron transport regulator)
MRPTTATREDLLRVLSEAARREGHGDVPATVDAESRRRTLASMRSLPSAPRSFAARSRAPWLAAAALAAVLAAVLGVFVLRRPSRGVLGAGEAPLAFTVDGAAAHAGVYVHGDESEKRPLLHFSEGSEIVFAPRSSGRVAEVDARGARVLLESGTASFTITHLPGTRWSVEAGPFVIAVIGTAFDASWSVEAQTLEVRVREGEVSVSGPLAPDGAHVTAGRRLSANLLEGELRIGFISAVAQATTSPAPAAAAAPSSIPSAPQSYAGLPSAPQSYARPPHATAHLPTPRLDWARRVAEGDYRGVLADADARGVDGVRRLAPLADLAALADAARYAGRPALARDALLSVRARFAGAPEARAAAFLLGRLADDGGGPTQGAVSWYDMYLAESPSGPFAAEALGRKLTALRRAKDPAARSAADEYLRRYPDGPYAAAARELATP